MAQDHSTVLSNALAAFTPPKNTNLLVGHETADSAAIYRLSSDVATINTVRLIPQPVADPYWFGQIAAANALGKVYALGGRPVTALNIVLFPGEQQKRGTVLEVLRLAFFPSRQLDLGIFQEILRGGHDKVIEAGACLAGGQSLHEAEPQYGLCVNGVVHPEKIITPTGARTGDALILTKPLGAGVLLQAVRAGKYPFQDLEKETLPHLAALNNKTLEAALEFDLHACADVSNAGILGCLLNIARGAQAGVMLNYQDVVFYPGAVEMYQKGVITDSNKANRALLARHDLRIQTGLSAAETELLYDPQVSGGLLLALPKDQALDLLAALRDKGVKEAVCIGEIVDEPVGIRIK
ncbi:MAG: selenide, water dikinase SelD [Candidatus Electrothrix sp. GW3-4]|uniref:selenide, water dikinase SelD n=1 Tax=Candidatus Electrothrix sp. GW3-4 TaxID=3126740 RepID=UPI0030CEDE5D